MVIGRGFRIKRYNAFLVARVCGLSEQMTVQIIIIWDQRGARMIPLAKNQLQSSEKIPLHW